MMMITRAGTLSWPIEISNNLDRMNDIKLACLLDSDSDQTHCEIGGPCGMVRFSLLSINSIKASLVSRDTSSSAAVARGRWIYWSLITREISRYQNDNERMEEEVRKAAGREESDSSTERAWGWTTRSSTELLSCWFSSLSRTRDTTQSLVAMAISIRCATVRGNAATVAGSSIIKRYHDDDWYW